LRSVFVFFDRATDDEVRGSLADWHPGQSGPQWIATCAAADDPVLYVEIDRSLLADLEPGALESLHSTLGGAPTAVLVIDVSGRHDGLAEVQQYISRVLSRFSGLACDDYSDDLWTRDEVANATKSGRRFFRPG
jgi:hypothetical protein